MEKLMTIQQAAAWLLDEYKKPLKSKELAKLAQERMQRILYNPCHRF